MLTNAKRDSQTVTPTWEPVQRLIDGVSVYEMKNVLGPHKRLTEIFRPEWEPSGLPVVHVYQVLLYPGHVSDWNCHLTSLDRLFFGSGHIRLALFDGREHSPTYRRVNEFNLGEARPALVTVPPGVWHALQCCGPTEALIINLPSHAYDYEDPDHYRLPSDTPEIPYTWRA